MQNDTDMSSDSHSDTSCESFHSTNEDFLPDDEDLEPIPNEQEAAEYAMEVARENEEEEMLLSRFSGEVDVVDWCKCSNCSLDFVVKCDKCRCCMEVDRCREKIEEIDEEGCIIDHVAFTNVCLDTCKCSNCSLDFVVDECRCCMEVDRCREKIEEIDEEGCIIDHVAFTNVNINYAHLEGLELADYDNCDNGDGIDILIGADQYWNFVTGDIVRGDDGPTAISSKLGWLLSGCLESSGDENKHTVTNLIIAGERFDNSITENDNDTLNSSLKRFWDVETIGIAPIDEENQGKPNFIQDISFNGDRYEVGLPWKEDRRDIETIITVCN
ncbi:hypothetical protein QZH41_008029 [Actinostola sp. cb2023]|nr:hypothetical protein QZH41_008029 [Actinostola sp. cb2023]